MHSWLHHQGLCTPLDVVNAGEQRVTDILVEQMPFHDDAPTRVGRMPPPGPAAPGAPAAAGAGAGVGGQGGGGGTSEDTRRRQVEACRRLAAKIMKRATYVVGEELELLNNQ